MVEIISWMFVAVIALGALVGFTGVVATSVLSVVRHLRTTGVQRPAAARRPVTHVG